MGRFHSQRTLLLAAVVLLLGGEAPAQEIERAAPEAMGMASSRLDRIRDMLREEVEQGHIGSAVGLIARDGKIVFVHAAGDAAPDVPMFDDAIMRLASAGKGFTAAAAMILYERGVLDLDDPVADYIPAFLEARVTETDESGRIRLVEPARAVTVRDLLRHTGGLAVASDEFEESWMATQGQTTTRDLAQRIARLAMPAHPGTTYDYGYYGSHYEVLAAVIEAASGQTLEEFLDENLFEPLKMDDSYFWVPSAKLDRLPAIYQIRDGQLSVYRERGDENPRSTFLSGGGGVRSTVRDLHRFVQMLLNGGRLEGVRILSPKSVALMTTDHVGDLMTWRRGEYGWGLGFSVRKRVRDHDIGSPGTFGWAGGSGAQWWADPAEGLVGVLVAPFRPPPHWEAFERFERLMYAAVTRSRVLPGETETPGVQSPSDHRDPPVFDLVQSLAREAVQDSGVPAVVVAVSQRDRPDWSTAYGWIDESKTIPASVSQPLPLASITKVFTAVALMQLVSQGDLALDDSIGRHLPPALVRALPPEIGSLTLARLARHTAGLPAYYRNVYTSFGESPPRLDTVLVRYAFLAQPPRTRYRYSNLGYLLLQRAIEHRSGLSFEDYVRRHIATPLGMASVYEKRAGDPMPAAIAGRDRLGQPVDFYLNDTPGASSLYASAEDLVRFGWAAITPGVLLDSAAIAEMYRSDPDGLSPHGIGWYVNGEAGGVHHGGWMAGASTGLFIDRHVGLVTAVLSTASPPWPYMVPDSIHHAVLRTLNAESDPEVAMAPNRDAGPDEGMPLGSWVGRVVTWAGEFPLRLELATSTACVAFDDSDLTVLRGYNAGPSSLQGRFTGTLRTPDAVAHGPHVLILDLLQHEEILRGEMMAWTPDSPERFGLSAFVELDRVSMSPGQCGES